MRDPWRQSAACRDMDPELFFPDGSSRAGHLQAEQACRICARCPVRIQCLREAHRIADAGFEVCGIWGGTLLEINADRHHNGRGHVTTPGKMARNQAKGTS